MKDTKGLIDAQAVRSPQSYSARCYSAHSLAAIVRELESRGIAASEALDGTDIDQTRLDIHTLRVSYRQLDTVMSNALRLSTDPTVAFAAGARMRITSYGMYGYALLSSARFEQSAEISNRYMCVVGPLCDAVIQPDGATTLCTIDPMYWSDTSSGLYRFAVEFGLAAHLAVRKDLCGSGFRFMRISVVYGPPPYADAYSEIFGCPVLFGQPANEFRHDIKYSQGPMPFPDARTNAMTREMCEDLLTEINSAGGTASEVRRLLIEQLGNFRDLEGIAKLLGLHPRALRRKLAVEGTSFRNVLSDVRMRLAIEYLRKTMLTNEEIAYRLGYSDSANFRHAFKRWTSKTPSDFRKSSRHENIDGGLGLR